jgi:hypothetical protein
MPSVLAECHFAGCYNAKKDTMTLLIALNTDDITRNDITYNIVKCNISNMVLSSVITEVIYIKVIYKLSHL